METILIAEDDQGMLAFLTRMFERRGYQVTACDNGEDAYGHLQQTSFTLLLTDIVMPGMDGIELSQKARALYPDIKIMFVTGFSALYDEKTSGQHQPDCDTVMVSKPFHLKDLVDKAELLLAS